MRVTSASLAFLVGAALTGCGSPPTHARRLPSPPPVPSLGLTARQPVTPDVSALPTESPRPRPRPAEYLRLTATECRELAIRNAPLADALTNHADEARTPHPLAHKRTDAAHVKRVVRGYAADESRNRAAGDALESFFRLAEAEGQFDILVEARAELGRQVASARNAAASGFADRADLPALLRQGADLDAQLAKAEAGIAGLNASLRGRLGLPPNDPHPLWPDDPLRVRPDDIDVAEAVRTGLHYRPDLNLLRAVLSADDDLLRAVLSGANPLLAAKATPPGAAVLLCLAQCVTHAPNPTTEAMRQQVAGLLAERERQAEAEIRAAAAAVRGNRDAATARAVAVRVLADHVAELTRREKTGQAVTAELAKAKLDLLKARGELLTAVADWHVSAAKLRQAMGVLVRE